MYSIIFMLIMSTEESNPVYIIYREYFLALQMDSGELHQIWYLVWLTIWIYTVLYLFTIEMLFYQVMLLILYNVQTTNLTFFGKIWDVQSIDIALRNSK